MRIATGTSTSAATSESANAPASCSWSGNLHRLRHEAVLAVVRNDVVDGLVDRVARRPADCRLEVGCDRLAVRDLFEARLVRLLERDEANVGSGAGALDYTLRKVEDADLAGATDVEHVTVGLLALEQPKQRPDGVVHVQEAAALAAVAVDRQVLAGERLAHEARQHHPVLAGLT